MKKLSYIEWNINGRSKNFSNSSAGFILDSLKNDKADIIILTEYVQSEIINGGLNNLGYEVFTNKERFGNKILIALKKGIFFVERTFELSETGMNPNFLGLTVQVDGKTLDLIGCRVRIGGEANLRVDFVQRRMQVLAILEFMKQKEIGNGNPVLVLGDWNSGFYEDGDTPESFNGKPRSEYSLPRLAQIFEKHMYSIHTPKIGASFGHNLRLDHAFSKELVIDNLKYDRKFMFNDKYQNNKVGFPDHAKLIGVIS